MITTEQPGTNQSTYSEYTDPRFGITLEIEPPLHVGRHVIDSFGKLAAIAVLGVDASPNQLDKIVEEVDRTLDNLAARGEMSNHAEYLTNVVLGNSSESKHIFYQPIRNRTDKYYLQNT